MTRDIAAFRSVALLAAGSIVAATGATSGLLGLRGASASAAEGTPSAACSPREAVAANFSDWRWDRYTDWQLTPATPTDPDAQSGAENPLNLVRIGVAETREIIDMPAQAAFDEPAGYIKWTYNPGKDGVDVPVFDADDPHWNQTSDRNKPDGLDAGLVHQSESGNGNWVYWQPIVVHHDAVPALTHTEYRWSIDTRTYTPARDAVDCTISTAHAGSTTPSSSTPEAGEASQPATSPTTSTPADPTTSTPADPTTSTPASPTTSTPADPTGTQHGGVADAHQQTTPRGSAPAETVVPTVIDAGL